MAGKKNAKSNKTEHVLNLLSGGSTPRSEPAAPGEPAPQAAPAEAERPEERPSAAPAPAASPSRPLSPPILEVARVNHEALSETIHSALAEALQEELGEMSEAPVPADEPVLAETSAPVEEPVPAETPAPVEEPIPAEIPAPVEEPVPMETPAPVEEPVPVEIPAPVEEPVPTETPAPAEEPVPAEAPAPEQKSTPPQQPPPQPAPEPGITFLPDGARLINVMEILVADKLERYVKLFGLCDCPRCLADTTALALSRLPAKYVVLPPHAFHPMMELYRSRYDGDITAQIVFACKAVMESPRHNLS